GGVANDVADARGFVILTKHPGVPKGTISWALPKKAGEALAQKVFSQEVFFDFDPDADAEASERLVNLGFGDRPTLKERVGAFQEEYKDDFDLESGGVLGPKTREAIKNVHDQLADDIRDPKSKASAPPA